MTNYSPCVRSLKRELSGLRQPQQFIAGSQSAPDHFWGIPQTDTAFCKLLFISHHRRAIRILHHINIQVNPAQDAPVKRTRERDIRIEKRSLPAIELPDIVPPICPVQGKERI
jgi:hypothetical protein